ncbi:MAG TPA: FlgD immunoglobulin-like domain containing protein, partial [Candidatus Krumholzibacteria bacterium]|nr:FlgD immunoglobulin-like domain containing protein [Candidatus Krumholzibacteria bacterium]
DQGLAVLAGACGPSAAPVPAPSALGLTAWPNPFNPRTTLAFTLPASGPVTVGIHDVRGRLLRRLQAGTLAAGPQRLVWDGCDDAGRAAASGVYLAVVRWQGGAASTKLLLAR